MFKINKNFYPDVVRVHRLITYLTYNSEVQKVCHCPFCMMPEFSNSDLHSIAYCVNCERWPRKDELHWLTRESYIFLLRSLPLKNGGALFVTHSSPSVFPNVTYADLDSKKLSLLDDYI